MHAVVHYFHKMLFLGWSKSGPGRIGLICFQLFGWRLDFEVDILGCMLGAVDQTAP